MTKYPKISVLLPTYNSASFLSEAINSILMQSYSDFELLIINDCSTDVTPEIFADINDQRVRIIDNDQNLGLAASLNRGLALARGKFIARMDADDISMPDRFKKQVEFMEANPKVGVLGSWYQWMDTDGNPGKIVRFPTSNGVIQWQLIVDRQPLAHPVVMMRAEALRAINGYKDMRYSQDYDLFSRLAKDWELANLPVVLLLRREHPGRIGLSYKEEQIANTARTRQEMMLNLLEDEIPLELVRNAFPPNSNGVDDLPLLNLLERIYKRFFLIHPLSKSERKEIQHEVAVVFSSMVVKNGIKRARYFLKAICMAQGLLGDIVKKRILCTKLPVWLYKFLQGTWRLSRKIFGSI